MSRATEAADRFQQKHSWAGLPLAVLYKFFDDQGNYLAALVTYYAIVSLFPLLLLLVTILGYVLHNNADLRDDVLNSAFKQIPVLGPQLQDQVDPLTGKIWGLIVGIAGSLYGGLGVAQACQNAMNKMWAVPRNARPNPIKARGISLLLLLIVGGGVLATTVLTALTVTAGSYGANFGPEIRVFSQLAAIAVNSVLFVLAFRILTAKDISIRQVSAGAIAAAFVWQGLQEIGTLYVGHLQGSSATYGTFGLILGLIAWIYLGAVAMVFCAEFNVVWANRLWPRSLLTPFTDNVRLTPGDRRAYTSYPETERHKGFETVDVRFDQPDPPPAEDA